VKVWYICRDDKFTIKSCSTLIDRLMMFNRTCSFKSSIWNKAAPPQNETLYCRLQNRQCTRSFISSRRLSLEQCFFAFCAAELESSDHMLLLINFAWKKWTKSLSWRVSFDVFQNELTSCCFNGQQWLMVDFRG
jgi:hypothetical protein